MKVFVYGTLKPGLRYHHVAQGAGLTYQEEAYLDGFELYHLEPENYPALVPGKSRVYGWRLSFADEARALNALDELEGVHLNPPEYKRVIARSQPGTEAVWLYLYCDYERLKTAEHLPDGNWQPKAAPEHLPKGLS